MNYSALQILPFLVLTLLFITNYTDRTLHIPITIALFLALVGIVLVYFVRISMFGFRLSKNDLTHTNHTRSMNIALHKQAVKKFIVYTVLAVLTVECLRLQKSGSWGDETLLAVHHVAIGTFVASLVLMMIYTGVRAPRIHRTLYIILVLAFGGISGTGFLLLSAIPA